MAGIVFDTLTGELVIAGISMHCAAWEIVDLRDLWFTPAVRGEDRVIPYVNGARPYRRRITVTPHSLPLVISGEADRDGVAPPCDPDPRVQFATEMRQLQANLDFLRANVVDPTGVGDGTRAATLTMPSGPARAALIHVLSITPGERMGTSMLGTLDISIPGGGFV